ncbi:MAG TPA: DMT family transporter, partial [Xanthomonadaceae bacterium]|nr:DMT family transporter [Xanthomonadaceae bacterium]
MSTVDSIVLPRPASRARAWRNPLELGLLGAIWGGSFLFMRVAAKDFGPTPLVEVRLALGALMLSPFLWRARASFPAKLWPKLALIGAINSAVPFVLFAWGAERAPAGIGAICNSMAVLFTALVGFLFYREKIGMQRAVALLTGFVGVVVLASGKTAGASIGLAVAAGTTAAFLYGIGVNLVRRHLVGLPP